MLPYFIIFTIIAMFGFCEVLNIRKEDRVILLFITIMMMIIFAGLRYGTADYSNYQQIYINAKKFNPGASADVGFSLMSYLLNFISNDPIILFFTTALLAVSINIICYKNYGKYVLVAVLFYFVHTFILREMIQIRAGLACAIGLYNIRNLQDGRFNHFWILQLLAMSIHLGAIMYIVAYILQKWQLNRKILFALVAASFVVGTVYPFGAILKQLPEIAILYRAQQYAQSSEYAETIGILTNLATIKQLILSFASLYFYDHLKKHINFFHILLSMYIASTCWLMIWNDFAIVGARMATFLAIGEPILIAGLLHVLTPKSRIIAVITFIGIALILLSTNMPKLTDYQFYPTL